MEKMAEEQKNKYLGLYTILPSEVSLQLAEVALDLGTIHDQVNLWSGKSAFSFFLKLRTHMKFLNFHNRVSMETELTSVIPMLYISILIRH